MKKKIYIYIYLLYVVYTVTLTIFTTVFKCVYCQRYTLTNPVLLSGKSNGIRHICMCLLYHYYMHVLIV